MIVDGRGECRVHQHFHRSIRLVDSAMPSEGQKAGLCVVLERLSYAGQLFNCMMGVGTDPTALGCPADGIFVDS